MSHSYSLWDEAVALIECGDVLSLVIAILVVLMIGRNAVDTTSTAYGLGRRMAFLAFAAWLARDTYVYGLNDADQLAHAALRGLLAAGLALALAWLILPIAEYVWEHAFRRLFRRVQSIRSNWVARTRSRAEAQRRQREQERAAQLRAEPNPDWAKQEREAERRLRKERDEQRRRENSRFECQVLFDRYRPELAPRFADTQLAAYFQHYMSDERSAEEVERRAEVLKTMFRESVEPMRDMLAGQFQSIDQIAAHFRDKKDRILATDYDDDMKDTLIIEIERDESQILREFMKR